MTNAVPTCPRCGRPTLSDANALAELDTGLDAFRHMRLALPSKFIASVYRVRDHLACRAGTCLPAERPLS